MFPKAVATIVVCFALAAMLGAQDNKEKPAKIDISCSHLPNYDALKKQLEEAGATVEVK